MLYCICHWFWGAKLEDGKKSFFLKDEKLQAFARKSILKFLAGYEKEKAKACRNRWLFYFLLNSVNSVNPFSGYSLLVVFLLLFANSPFLVWQSVFIFWGNLIKRSPRMAKYAMLAMTDEGVPRDDKWERGLQGGILSPLYRGRSSFFLGGFLLFMFFAFKGYRGEAFSSPYTEGSFPLSQFLSSMSF